MIVIDVIDLFVTNFDSDGKSASNKRGVWVHGILRLLQNKTSIDTAFMHKEETQAPRGSELPRPQSGPILKPGTPALSCVSCYTVSVHYVNH